MADTGRPSVVIGDSSGHDQAKDAKSQPNNPANGTTHPKPELSNAEKKALQKKEKTERRAKEKAAAGSAQFQVPSSQTIVNGDRPQSAQQQKKQAGQDAQKRDSSQQRRRNDPVSASPGVLRMSMRPKHDPNADERVIFFSHLYSQSRKRSLEGTPKDVHPTISALALQQSNYIICGSHARGVAMLLALKAVIESYTTPHGNSLPRHLASHYLTPQLTHLKSSRPFSTTQANSIRWLKNFVANIDPSVPEEKAKQDICEAINTFISEKFTIADQVIAEAAADHILNGDVVVIFGKSAVVQAALLSAARRGRQFRTVVIDSRPLFEGKSSAHVLWGAGMDVQYAFLNGIEHATRGVTKCFLGAHAILGNGRLYSRAGTALVAMVARLKRAEIIVCAETIKFSERVALDSITGNELAPEEELFGDQQEQSTENDSAPQTDAKGKQKDSDKKGQLKGKVSHAQPSVQRPGVEPRNKSLHVWREIENLLLLNPLYDVTPTEYIDSIITELGTLPPGSAPAVQRLSAGS